MNKTFLKLIGTGLLTVWTLMICTHISALTHESVKPERGGELKKEMLSAPRDGARALEGVWDALVTFRNCRTGAPVSPANASMATYMQGGTMQEFGVASGLFRSQAHGVWNYAGGATFSNAFEFFRFNPDGTYAEKVIVRRQIELNQDNVYNATSSIDFYDTNGNLIRRACAVETATRFL